MSRTRGLWTSALCLCVAAGAAWAATVRTSERFSFSTYRERVGPLTVLVDGYVASLHEEDPYVPVPVAIGWSGKGALHFTPESFALVDGSGRAYPAASYQEILRRYAKLTFDRSLVRQRPIVVGQQFTNYTFVPARFYPGVDRGTRISRVELGRFAWFYDVLYFPTPEAGLEGVLTLRVSPAGIGEPAEVRFTVPGLQTARRR